MEMKSNNPEIVNDLIKINNDRIEGYSKALSLCESLGIDDNLDRIFKKFIDQSSSFIAELAPYVEHEGEETTENTKMSGKIFRWWMGVKVNTAGDSKKSLLESCEKGEKAFRETYKKVLNEHGDELSIPVKNIIQMQLSTQLEAQQNIKVLHQSETL
ncbi:PA2169 family four-helix-bundle protein [Sphingobacterium sp. N143]|uniref:PA2169 family four-helix-bundle protein n=1 Tax=Sphingobacterium sp. N143 TaxID=2746727 RepID=UPI0025764A68|nr:PA2169 family four-helix-bundle protein [Sphingobacterium sp. N143]MDM1292723.1 PA2169 family four-helix-bundle protein [Sphingobacterium sp. N143]